MARTAVGLVLEDERYTLDIRVLDRDGNPAKGEVWFYEYGSDWVYTLPLDATGRAPPQRVRPGMYDVSIWLDVPGESGGPTPLASHCWPTPTWSWTRIARSCWTPARPTA